MSSKIRGVKTREFYRLRALNSREFYPLEVEIRVINLSGLIYSRGVHCAKGNTLVFLRSFFNLNKRSFPHFFLILYNFVKK